MAPAQRPTPHLVVLQQHGVGEALVQAQLRELPAGASDVQNQVRAGDVAEDVQEDLIGEVQQVGPAWHRSRRGGHVAIAAQVLKQGGTKSPWDPQGQPSPGLPGQREKPAGALATVRGKEGALTENLNCQARTHDNLRKPLFQLRTEISLQKQQIRNEI